MSGTDTGRLHCYSAPPHNTHIHASVASLLPLAGMQRYHSIKQLGDGTFGSVSLARVTDTGELVAIKK